MDKCRTQTEIYQTHNPSELRLLAAQVLAILSAAGSIVVGAQVGSDLAHYEPKQPVAHVSIYNPPSFISGPIASGISELLH